MPNRTGSWLGRIAFKIANGNDKKADLYCRGLIYILLGISFIPCTL